MQFDLDDEQAFSARRDELGEQFATWLRAHEVAGDPNAAGWLMECKVGYGDGALDRWSIADVEEFLFEWCVRKLSAPPRVCAEIPPSVAAFVEFLADTGLLAPSGDPPSQIRRYCEQHTKEFVRAMGNPANFGRAKSLFGGLGELLAPDDPELPAIVQELLGDEDVDWDDDEETPVVGPVAMPAEQERRDAIHAAPAPRQLRLLAQYCAPPGRPLTGKGNVRLADARHLVAALETGDDLDFGGRRKLASTEDLPTLSWLVELALEAGVVRRTQGKLIAVARFADLDEAAAYEKVVRAAIVVGLSGRSPWPFAALDVAQAAADECVVGLLADLLDADADGVGHDELIEIMTELLEEITFGLPAVVAGSIPGWVLTQVERLAALGMVTADDARVELTAAGVPVAIELVRESGVQVLLRPDPATADAAAIADLLGWVDQEQWAGDASAWIAAQPDRAAAVDGLVAEVCAEHREPAAVMVGLDAIGDLAGEAAVTAVRRQVGGPYDGLVLNWLAARSAIDPTTIDPLRFVAGLVDILATALDLGGPREAVAAFDHGANQAEQLELLDHIWRLHHPRLPDVLQVIGADHPVKVVAKAARKSLTRHRSWLANPPAG